MLKTRLMTLAAVLLGALVVSETATAQITADAGEDQTVAAGENCDAVVTLDGSASVVPDGVDATFIWTGPFPEGDGMVEGVEAEVTLEPGVHEIMLEIDDGTDAEPATDTVMITVEDQTAPTIHSITANKDMLWPPNHKMHEIVLKVDATDNCDDEVECEIVDIESNEADNGKGDGNTRGDAVITGDLTANLRAERSGRGDGRVYTLKVVCRDGDGNESSSTVEVRVPHDMGDRDDDDDDDANRCVVWIDFRRDNNDRLKAKLDVDDAVTILPVNDTDGIGDDVAGYELELDIAGEEVSGTFDEDGVIDTDDLYARLTNDGMLCLKVSGLDLADGLGLEPSDRRRNEELDVPIKATVIPPEDDGGDPVVIFDETITCIYSQKPGKRGKGAKKAKKKRRRRGRR